MLFIKLKYAAQRHFEQKRACRSSVLGLIIIGNFSLKFEAKELASASLFPVSWKPCSEQTPPVTWILPPLVPVYSELALGLLTARIPLCHQSVSRMSLQNKGLQTSIGHFIVILTHSGHGGNV